MSELRRRILGATLNSGVKVKGTGCIEILLNSNYPYTGSFGTETQNSSGTTNAVLLGNCLYHITVSGSNFTLFTPTLNILNLQDNVCRVINIKNKKCE